MIDVETNRSVVQQLWRDLYESDFAAAGRHFHHDGTGGSVAALPFVSVHVLLDGRILRWSDYWDLQTLLGAAPQCWLDHIVQGYS